MNWLVRDGIDGGTLALWAGISAAIEATEVSVEAPADMVAAGRAVVSDDGRLIRLTVYREARAVAAVTLAPRRVVALAGELIAAALPKLRAP